MADTTFLALATATANPPKAYVKAVAETFSNYSPIVFEPPLYLILDFAGRALLHCKSKHPQQLTMAPYQGKSGPTNESFARSKRPAPTDDRSVKRARQDEAPATERKPASAPIYVPKVSKLKEEEAAFPRGGASVLTPLEHKQINIEATRDVLFEQEAASRAQPADAAAGGKKKKPTKKGKKGEDVKPEEDEDHVRIEGLSYKRLVPGSIVLGQVSQINPHDIAVSLPNNLTGYVPLTSISTKLTERVEKLVAQDGKSDVSMEDAEEDEDDIDLPSMFTIGQYVRAFVISTTGNSEKPTDSGKRRIELSIHSEQANAGITAKELVPNTMVMASVVSVEDHGLIMDIGLSVSGIGGFMSSKEIGYGVDLQSIEEGAVFLSMITGVSSNGKIVKLSADTQKFANPKKPNYITDAPTIDAFLPGTAVEILVTDVTPRGVAGKIMGSIDATADLMHSGLASSTKGFDLEKKYKLGSKIKARIICTFPGVEPKKLGVSLLEHVMSLSSQKAELNREKVDPLSVLPPSAIAESVTVRKVQPGVGLFVDVGVKGVPGFVHISRVTDGKIEILSETTGPFKVDSAHKGRVVGYNPIDGMYMISLEHRILEQPFLRVEDVSVGQVVQGKIEKLIVNARGFGGLLVNLAEGISGLVPEMHVADVSLLHPEKKFKEGMKVTARVVSTDPSKRQIRLTLKKSLLNSEAPIFKDYKEIAPGAQSPGTIVSLLASGAVVQFFGDIRGFLPVSEMSESFIKDPKEHFRIGQVVNVHVLNVDAEEEKLTVSCKDPSTFGTIQQNAFAKLKIGEVVSGAVTEKSNDDISLELPGGLRAVLPLGHLTDGSQIKNAAAFKKIRVGQTLTDLIAIEKFDKKHVITLTNKPSLVKAAKDRTLVRAFEDVKEGKIVHGFVKNITLTAVFVQFGGGLTGLLPKMKLPEEAISLPDFGLRKHQSVTAKVISVDHGQMRFLLSVKDVKAGSKTQAEDISSGPAQATVNPVDEEIKNVEDFTVGRVTKARIQSVKDTQINVLLADNVQGRIDVSQAFSNWENIKDRKHPLKSFSSKQVISVRVLGMHDAKNHRFLPITHRAGKTPVFELSAKTADQTDAAPKALTLEKVKAGSSWIAFVNNIGDDCLWVNLSPNVRGRISALEVSDDVSVLNNLEANFPVGSAIRVHVISVDTSNNRLDLSARSAKSENKKLIIENLSKAMILPGKVTKVTERQIMVQLSDNISGPVNLTDLADDYSQANPLVHNKNDIVRVYVADVDQSNKRVRLSTRPSRVLNSALPVQDPEVSSISQLKVNDVVRGFVKNVADNGVFVNLGGDVTAYVRVSDLSDSFLKEWKSNFQVDQLVKGKVIVVDENLNHIQLSLKASVLDKDYVPPITFNDLQVGQIVTGKIRKVEDFGVFIVVDGSMNVSGLCHRSEMADDRVTDVKKLYSEGDAVKAIVLKIDAEKKRVNFGLKASYVGDNEDNDEEMEDDDEGDAGVDSEEDSEMEGGVKVEEEAASDESEEEEGDEDVEEDVEMGDAAPLTAGGFDWTASVLDEQPADVSDAEDKDASKKKKKRKPTITVDRTGDLDANGPQSTSDFERLLLGQPDSSELWIQYMAFQMKLSELAKAREVAERAIRTINIREETEKLNIWIALLNLENAYGSDETTEEVFKRACQYNDALEIHQRLTSIYIQSGKHGVSTTASQHRRTDMLTTFTEGR